MKTILTAVLVLVVAGLTALAVIKYDHQPHQQSYAQVVAERESALTDLSVTKQTLASTKSADAQKEANLQNVIKSVCASLKTTKVTNPACQ